MVDFEYMSDGATVWSAEGIDGHFRPRIVFADGHLHVMETGHDLGTELDFDRVERLRDVCDSYMAWRRGRGD